MHRLSDLINFRNTENARLPSTFRPSMVSSSHWSKREIAPVLIEFDDWDRGRIFEWYRKLPTTTFKRIELWKEREDFKHEFVVVYMEESTILRIERRPHGGATPEAILTKGSKAEDSITPITIDEIAAFRSDADVQITVGFEAKKPDLYAVIAVCVASQMDEESKKYTLQQYNCYFLARTIVTLIVRHYLHISLDGLRWDNVTPPAVEKYIFGSDPDVLDASIKKAIIEALESTLWPIIKADAETLIDKQKDWTELQRLAREAIAEATIQIHKLSINSVKGSFNRWISEATQETLWRGNFEENISTSRYRCAFGKAAEGSLVTHASPELQSQLPLQMVIKLEPVLPKRFVERMPATFIARMPLEVWSRLPSHVMEKAPDAFLLKLPDDFARTAPDELFQRLPDSVLARCTNRVIFGYPEVVRRVPDRLIKIGMQRLQTLLDEPLDHPDRPLGLKFLSQLPEDILKEFPEKYRELAIEAIENPALIPNQDLGGGEAASEASRNEDHSSSQSFTPRKRRFSILGLAIHVAPRPVLERFPCVISAVPISWLKTVPPNALEKLPPKWIARIPSRCLARLPTEVIENLPTSLLQTLPRRTIERLPDSFLERIPTRVLRRLPVEFLENIPENLSDQLRQALGPETFMGPLMKDVMTHVNEAAEEMLKKTPDKFPENVIRVSVRSRSKIKAMGEMKILERHEDLQDYVLDMITRHSRKVSKVARLGLGEQAVYNGLRDKMGAIWRVMRLHTTPPHRFARILG